MATQIQLRRDTAANWTSTNPTLAQGEPGLETDTGKLKLGDGTTAWNSLAYQAAANIVDGTIVNADINASAAIADTKLATIATAGKVSNSATTAASANTANAIVARDASGNFSAGTVTANLTGAASLNVLKAGDTMTGPLSVPLGSASAPSIYPGTDTNTGIYSPGADQVAISTNGSNRLHIASDGKVGLGTTSPDSQLSIRSNLADTGISIGSGGLPYNLDVNFLTFDNTPDGRIRYNPASLAMSFWTASTERARIDSSGKLLIGTSSSRSISGAERLVQIEGVGAAGTHLSIIRHSNDGAGANIYLTKSRGTAVGSSTIVSALDDLGGIFFSGFDGSKNVVGAGIIAATDGTPAADDMPGKLLFLTTADGASSPTERARISNDGFFTSFGTTDVVSVRSAAGAGTTNYFYRGGHSATATTGSTTLTYYVYTNGNVQNTNNSYTGISDIKLKENIVDASSQWSDIKALQVRKYNFKEETGQQTHIQIGLIAQEAELVSPGLVSESPDRDEDGNDLGTTTKSVNYSVLYMKAVKALQEAMERIETLETKVAALEGV